MFHPHWSRAKYATLSCAMLLALTACDDLKTEDFHRSLLEKDLQSVKYSDGINIREAKVIAEAYLFVYGDIAGPAPQVYIHNAQTSWRATISGGMAINPHDSGLPPVMIDQKSGLITWELGPEIDRIDLSLAPKKDYYNANAIPEDAR
ncbi:MAG: hypothetical protein HQM07_05185 [Zetaproteobacteria bacterium]|nr:hypothetical protein [Zetaproteobacteria bacterium]